MWGSIPWVFPTHTHTQIQRRGLVYVNGFTRYASLNLWIPSLRNQSVHSSGPKSGIVACDKTFTRDVIHECGEASLGFFLHTHTNTNTKTWTSVRQWVYQVCFPKFVDSIPKKPISALQWTSLWGTRIVPPPRRTSPNAQQHQVALAKIIIQRKYYGVSETSLYSLQVLIASGCRGPMSHPQDFFSVRFEMFSTHCKPIMVKELGLQSNPG